jgi:hypothetical protein
MKTERHRFRPESLEPLEQRLVLTHGGPIAPALVGTLSPIPFASGRSGRVVAQVSATYDQFVNDYLQAQGAYLSSAAAQATFTTYTTQRVNLLAQQLTQIFALLPGSFSKIQDSAQRTSTNSAVLFQAFLHRNINGTGTTTDTGSSSLLTTLNSTAVVPPATPAKPTGAAASLYSLAATNAIQAARTATINAARFIARGTFSKH